MCVSKEGCPTTSSPLAAILPASDPHRTSKVQVRQRHAFPTVDLCKGCERRRLWASNCNISPCFWNLIPAYVFEFLLVLVFEKQCIIILITAIFPSLKGPCRFGPFSYRSCSKALLGSAICPIGITGYLPYRLLWNEVSRCFEKFV